MQGLRAEEGEGLRKVLLAVLAASSAALHGPAVSASESPRNALQIDQLWSRATPPGMTMGVGYFSITNRGKRADQLIGAASPRARAVELHQTIEEGGVSRMRPAKVVEISPGQTVTAKPGGLHLMLIGLKGPLVAGEVVPVTLEFRHAGKVPVALKVLAIASTGPDAAARQDSEPPHSH